MIEKLEEELSKIDTNCLINTYNKIEEFINFLEKEEK